MQTSEFPTRADLALVLLRVAVGGIFLAHGAQKLFVYGFPGVTAAFGGMHVPAPAPTGPLTALVEFFGGLALTTGLLTRLGALGLAAVMLGAVVYVHAAAGFYAPQGAEYPLALLATTLALAIAGPGRYSLDAVLASRRPALRASGRLAAAHQ